MYYEKESLFVFLGYNPNIAYSYDGDEPEIEADNKQTEENIFYENS